MGLASFSFISWDPQSNCVFGGCYILSKAGLSYPTLSIPATTCTTPQHPSPSLSQTTLIPSYPHTVVHTTPVSSTRPTTTSTAPMGDRGNLYSRCVDVWTDCMPLGTESLVIVLPVLLTGLLLYVLIIVAVLIFILYKKRHQSYE